MSKRLAKKYNKIGAALIECGTELEWLDELPEPGTMGRAEFNKALRRVQAIARKLKTMKRR